MWLFGSPNRRKQDQRQGVGRLCLRVIQDLIFSRMSLDGELESSPIVVMGIPESDLGLSRKGLGLAPIFGRD